MGFKEAGSKDKGLFGLVTLSLDFWGWVKEVGWWVSEADRAATNTARIGSGWVAGVGAAPEGRRRGVHGFWGLR